MACRSQSNPRFTSSDEVPPELAVLGSRSVLHRPVDTTGWTGSAQSIAGVDHFDDRSHVLVHPSVFGAILCQQRHVEKIGFCVVCVFAELLTK